MTLTFGNSCFCLSCDFACKSESTGFYDLDSNYKMEQTGMTSLHAQADHMLSTNMVCHFTNLKIFLLNLNVSLGASQCKGICFTFREIRVQIPEGATLGNYYASGYLLISVCQETRRHFTILGSQLMEYPRGRRIFKQVFSFHRGVLSGPFYHTGVSSLRSFITQMF